MVESNELIKKDFNTNIDSITLERQKKIFNDFLAERASKFHGIKNKINLNKLIYDFKTEKNIPKILEIIVCC